MSRDLKLGSLRLPTVENTIAEALGDELVAVGSAVTAGERRPRSMKINIPVHGDRSDPDPRATAMTLRRQLRALMANAEAKGQGLYFNLSPDPELNGWLVIGAAELKDGDGGVSLGDWILELADVYRVATRRTHRPARRLEIADRRLSTTPRDILARNYSTDYASLPSLAIAALPALTPEALADVLGYRGAPLSPAPRRAIDGRLWLLGGRTNGEALHFEQADYAQGLTDVAAWDRRGELGDATFETDSTSTATFDLGDATQLVPGTDIGAASAATNVRYVYAAQPAFLGAHYAAEFLQTAAVPWTDLAAGVVIRRIDAATYLAAYVREQGGVVHLRISAFTPAAGEVVLASAAIATVAPPTRLLVAAAITEEGTITASVFDRADATALASASFEIKDPGDFGALVDLSLFDGKAGHGGVIWKPKSATAKIENYRAQALQAVSLTGYGWEQVMGPEQLEQPYADDVPVLENGLCRVRWNYQAQATPLAALAIDSYVPGQGYREQGRLAPGYGTEETRPDDGFTIAYSRIAKLTPEEGVAHVRFRSRDTRIDVYLTLRRGWSGPQVDVYVHNTTGTDYASLNWYPIDAGGTNAQTLVVGIGTAPTVRSSDQPGLTWEDGVNLATGVAEPVAALTSSDTSRPTALFAWLSAATIVRAAGGTAGYGGPIAHNGVRFLSGAGVAGRENWLGLRLGFARRGCHRIEAETYRLAGASNSQIADANAHGGQAVQDTQAAATATTLRIVDVVPTLKLPPRARVAIFARIRATAAGGTASARANLEAAQATDRLGATVIGARAATTYGWVYLGEVSVANLTDDLNVTVWRSAGAGNAVIDALALNVTERRVTVDPSTGATWADGEYDGARDHYAANLSDVLPFAEVVAR